MFFGKYLIDKKVIAEDQLIEAMTFVEKSQPSFLKVLTTQNKLNCTQIVEALNDALCLKKDLQSILLEKNLISESELVEINKTRSHKGFSLGQALVELRFLPNEDLNSYITTYLKEKKDNIVPEMVKEPTLNEQETELSSAALESLRELGIVDESVIEDLESHVEEEVKESIGQEEIGGISSAALESLKELGIVDEAVVEDLSQQVLDEKPCVEEEELAQGDVAISAAALESLGELGIVDQETMNALEGTQSEIDKNIDILENTFVKKFSDEFYENLVGRVKSLTQGYDEEKLLLVQEMVDELYEVASFEEQLLVAKLLSCYQRVISKLILGEMDFSEINYLEVISSLKLTVDLSYQLKIEIEKKGKDISLEEQDLKWKQKYLLCLKNGYEILSKRVAS